MRDRICFSSSSFQNAIMVLFFDCCILVDVRGQGYFKIINSNGNHEKFCEVKVLGNRSNDSSIRKLSGRHNIDTEKMGAADEKTASEAAHAAATSIKT
jgi:hypothetical protein